MKQQIRVMEQNSQEITVQNITITNEDFNVLQDYQAKLCRKLEWVETDKKKIETIAYTLLSTGYLHEGNYLDILKKVISIYYRMRKKLTNKVRDQQLLASIINQYTMLSGMGIESLFTRVEETAKHVKDLLLHSVNQQKQGCKSSFLSGGLDSSILTALCVQKDWNTYSLDYEGNKENFHSNMYQVSMDTDYINMMKDKYPLLHHHDLMITQKELASLLEEAMLAREMPGMADVDSSLLWLCKQVKQQEDVIISGECSDEIFGGYPWFYREELKDLDTFPWLRSTKERISLLNKKYQTLEFEEYIKNQYNNTLKDIQYLDSDTQEDKLARKHTLLCLHWFMQTLVVRQVCEGRWAGVNIRAPFANVRLLEYVYNIPWKMKFLNDEEKGILRKAFADILPKEVCERKKNPFPKTHNPIYAQIVSDIVKDTLKDKNSPLHKLFDDKKLDELIQSKGESFQLPWYGQLMSGPQLLAYLYQIHCWIKDFDIEIEESI